MSISNSVLNLFKNYKNGNNYICSKEELETILLTISNTKIKKKMCCYFLWLKDNRESIKDKYFSDFDKIDKINNKIWSPEQQKKYYLSKGLDNYNVIYVNKPRIASLITAKAGILWKEVDENEKNKYKELSKQNDNDCIKVKNPPIENDCIKVKNPPIDNDCIKVKNPPIEKRKRGRPKKNKETLNVSDAAIEHYNKQTNVNNGNDIEIKVEEILFNGTKYWLDINNFDIYDPDTEEIVGKKNGGKYYIN